MTIYWIPADKNLKSCFPHAAVSQSPHETNVTAVSGSVKDMQILEARVHIEYFHRKNSILKVFEQTHVSYLHLRQNRRVRIREVLLFQ